jgi:hypothetical protein
MELAAEIDSDVYKKDSSAEDNEVEEELQEEQEEASVCVKSNWGLKQCARISRDVHRFTRHEKGLRKSYALTIDKKPGPLSVFMLHITAIIPLLEKRPFFVRS